MYKLFGLSQKRPLWFKASVRMGENFVSHLLEGCEGKTEFILPQNGILEVKSIPFYTPWVKQNSDLG